jgi:tRNA(fMet)-specific endonuclease VapC
MTLYMLDTNIASAAVRGATGIDDRLMGLDLSTWCISAITHAELRFGLALKPDAQRLIRCVEAFLDMSTTVAWDEAAADAHGRLRARQRLRGTPIGDFDEMIAAHALALGATLVTDNTQHFERVEGLALENWLCNN